MSVETSVSRDETSASLNTDAHATEHCAIDAGTLAEIGSALGRQVLVERSPELLALYTVDEISATPGTTFAGAEGIERLVLAPEPDGFRAVLRTRFTEGQGQGRLTEELLARGAGRLAILAPHGGAIERGTVFKHDVADAIRHALRGVMSEPPEVVVELDGPLAGALRANVVNRVTAAGNGIQIEQPLGAPVHRPARRDRARRRTAIRQPVLATIHMQCLGHGDQCCQGRARRARCRRVARRLRVVRR